MPPAPPLPRYSVIRFDGGNGNELAVWLNTHVTTEQRIVYARMNDRGLTFILERSGNDA